MCSNQQMLISNIDSLEYNDTLSEIELGDEKLDLFKSVGLQDIDFFKRYLNSTGLYKKDFEEFENIYKKNTSASPDFFIDYFSRKIIANLSRIQKSERIQNIENVNKKQKKDLRKKLCFGNKIEENIRNLVLYFRMQCMPEFEFQIIFHALKSLISDDQTNFSHSSTSLFNKLIVVSRGSQNIPDFARTHYVDVTENKFRDIMTLGSNGIHLTEGTLYEDRQMSTTTHIAGKAVLNKTQRELGYNKKMGENYIGLDLNFVDRKFINTDHLSIEEIIQYTVDSVLNLEQHMLNKS